MTGIIGIFVDITHFDDRLLNSSRNGLKQIIGENIEFIRIAKLELLRSLNSFVHLMDTTYFRGLVSNQQLNINKIFEYSTNLIMFINNALDVYRKEQPYLNKPLISKNYLKINNNEIFFTKREIQCLAHMFFGRTAKETARILNLSPKTVESYINSVKFKMDYHSRSQLVEMIIKNNLIEVVMSYVDDIT